MFVEDLLGDLASRILKPNDPVGVYLTADSWAKGFVESVHKSIHAGRALSSEQSRVFLNVITRMKRQGILVEIGYSDNAIDSFLMHPRHRRPPYQSTNVPKEVRYLGDNKLGFRCKRIDEIVHDIKALSNRGMDASWKENHRPTFDRTARIWIVTVTAETYQGIIKIIGNYDFHVDDAVIEYLALADSSKGQSSTFVYDPESTKIVANVCDNEIIEGWIKNVIFGEVM